MKKINNYIKKMSKKLPIQFAKAGFEQVGISHEDMRLSGLQEPEEGKNYLINVPIFHAVNHSKRMKKVFNANGIDGLKKYINERFI